MLGLARRAGAKVISGDGTGAPRFVAPLAAAAALLACGERPSAPGATETPAPLPAAQPASERFVVFTAPSLVVDRLNAPVALPVTVGSSPSPATLASDAPEVATIEADGSLVARRSGRATFRTLDGSGATLLVDVRPVSAFAVVPPKLVLRPGGAGQLRLVAAGSGEAIPPEAAQWATDAPGVALVIAGAVEAGERVGTAHVTASYGGQTARAVVAVERRSPPGSAKAKPPMAKHEGRGGETK